MNERETMTTPPVTRDQLRALADEAKAEAARIGALLSTTSADAYGARHWLTLRADRADAVAYLEEHAAELWSGPMGGVRRRMDIVAINGSTAPLIQARAMVADRRVMRENTAETSWNDHGGGD